MTIRVYLIVTRVIRLSPRSVASALAVFSVAFAVLTGVHSYIGPDLRPEPNTFYIAEAVLSLFNADHEASIPTWFSALLLLTCGMAAAAMAAETATNRKPYCYHWTGLAFLFLVMSIEEIAGFHERLMGPLSTFFQSTGYFYYSWVVVGLGAVVLFVAAYFRFWLQLAGQTRWLFALAAVLYVGGSIGIEMVSGNIFYSNGGPSIFYGLITAIEELCEMLGSTLFLYAQLALLARETPGLTITYAQSGCQQSDDRPTPHKPSRDRRLERQHVD